MTLKDKNLYFVGGVVRDEILGTTSFDTDFCYEGNAIEFAKNIGLNIIRENPDFGTVRVLYENQEIDIASTREEFYPQAGHLPVVKNIGCSLKDDLKRRDFTINAMAKNTVTGEIVDYFGGLEDIKNKKLRVLHKNSFVEDPTRILRALKFSVRFNFDLEDNTKIFQDEYLENINYDMSYHRLKKELKETFNLNNENSYRKFVDENIYKLLKNSIPPQNIEISNLINKYNPEYKWLVYLGLFNLSDLELTSEEKNIVQSIPNKKPDNDFEIFKLFKDLPLETILLYALNIDKKIACRYLDDLKNIKISINGDDLIEMGIPKGKIFKEIFDFVLKEKLRNPKLTKIDEIAIVKEKYGLN